MPVIEAHTDAAAMADDQRTTEQAQAQRHAQQKPDGQQVRNTGRTRRPRERRRRGVTGELTRSRSIAVAATPTPPDGQQQGVDAQPGAYGTAAGIRSATAGRRRQWQPQQAQQAPPQQQWQGQPMAQPYIPPQPRAAVAPAQAAKKPVGAAGKPKTTAAVAAPAAPRAGNAHGGMGAQPRFEDAPGGCRDWIFKIIFVLHLVAVFVIAGLMYKMFAKQMRERNDDDDPNSPDYDPNANHSNELKTDTHAIRLIGIVVAGSFVLAGLWLAAFKRCARQIIWAALIASPVFLIILGVLFLSVFKEVIPAVVCFLLAALNALFLYFCRSRIEFSATILSIVSQVLMHYPATTLVAFGAIIVEVVWIVVWVVAAVGVMHSFRNQEKTTYTTDPQTGQTVATTSGSGDGPIGGTYFMLLISFFWTLQVIKNVVHVTVAGVVGTFYFLAPDNLPSNPTAGALKRSMWHSFGSICFGSLIIAVVKAMRVMVEQARQADHPIVRCIVLCLLDCLESAVRYFNVYAFTQVAIYGKPYCKAASDTWNLLQSSGITALVNDDITGAALFFAALISGLIGAAGGALLARGPLDEPMWGLWALFSGLIAMGVVLIAMEVVASAVVAFFVCYAEDPVALRTTKPHLYECMVNAQTRHRGARPSVYAAKPARRQ